MMACGGTNYASTATSRIYVIVSIETVATGSIAIDDYLDVTPVRHTPIIWKLPAENWRWFRDIEPDTSAPVVGLPQLAYRPTKPQHRCDHGQRRRHIRRRWLQRLRATIKVGA